MAKIDDSWPEVFTRDNGRCIFCGEDLLGTMSAYGAATVDHLLKKKSEDRDEVRNLVLACKPCNGSLSYRNEVDLFGIESTARRRVEIIKWRNDRLRPRFLKRLRQLRNVKSADEIKKWILEKAIAHRDSDGDEGFGDDLDVEYALFLYAADTDVRYSDSGAGNKIIIAKYIKAACPFEMDYALFDDWRSQPQVDSYFSSVDQMAYDQKSDMPQDFRELVMFFNDTFFPVQANSLRELNRLAPVSV